MRTGMNASVARDQRPQDVAHGAQDYLRWTGQAAAGARPGRTAAAWASARFAPQVASTMRPV